jgi:hypothetical protein
MTELQQIRSPESYLSVRQLLQLSSGDLLKQHNADGFY